MKYPRDIKGQFSSKGSSINKFVTGVVWERVKITAMIFIFAFAVSAWTVSNQSSHVVEAETKIVTVEAPKELPSILKKIAQAESHNSHFCTAKLVREGMCEKGAEGQVLVNKTRDVGRYAINLYYNGKFCADKGLNVFDEKDNETCAIALFNSRGSEPWSASKYMWNK